MPLLTASLLHVEKPAQSSRHLLSTRLVKISVRLLSYGVSLFVHLLQNNGLLNLLWRWWLVFVGCNIAGAFFTLLLPEVRGRDPDVILAQEIEERRLRKLEKSAQQTSQ